MRSTKTKLNGTLGKKKYRVRGKIWSKGSKVAGLKIISANPKTGERV